MCSAFGGAGSRFTAAQAFCPTNESARISNPTRITAVVTMILAPPGNCRVLRPSFRPLDCQTKKARLNCATMKPIPVPKSVSPNCLSSAGPCTEMSTGIHQVCRTKNDAETSVITVRTTAKNFPIIESPRFAALTTNHRCQHPSRCRGYTAADACSVDPSRLIRCGGENEIRSLGLGSGDRHILRFRTVLFLPGRNGVFPWRQPADAEVSIFTGHCVVRSLQHHEVAVHPRMDVALYGDEFRLVPLRIYRRRAWRLRLVPFLICFRQRMDVVRGLVVVENLQLLARLHGQHVRQIFTAFLIVAHALRRSCGAFIAGGNVNYHPLQGVARTGGDVLRQDRSGVLLGARRFLGHINRPHLRRRSGVGHLAGDGPRSRRRSGKYQQCAAHHYREPQRCKKFHSHRISPSFLVWNYCAPPGVSGPIGFRSLPCAALYVCHSVAS